MTSTLTGRRTSGILLHPTSLPGRHGSGDLGPAAHQFVDFLAAAEQKWWQMLPVGPPGAAPGFSPYSSYSAFAGSPQLISLDQLVHDQLLDARDIDAPASIARGKDLNRVFAYRESRLRLAYTRFARDARLRKRFEHFVAEHSNWLNDFALFSALKHENHDRPWLKWPREIRLRLRGAIHAAQVRLAEEVRYHQFVQFLFDRQWTALKHRANDRGIGLIGDIPIFVALDSADIWAHSELFLLDKGGKPKVVSGCPADAFCPDGQLWGHPHYDWRAHERTGFAWWVERFQSMLHRFDAVRIDHFLGFHRAWAVPGEARNARHGTWLIGPREKLFRAVSRVVGKVPVIAEDLGAVTPEALKLRDDFKFPGMRVMQFGFGAGGEYHLPHNYPRRCVAYTGTHDNETAAGWYARLAASNGHAAATCAERDKALRYLNVKDGRKIHWAMIRAAMLSPADTVIFPVQDLLGLGAESRMNTPGVAEHQWRWRLGNSLLTPAVAHQLKELVELSDRNE